MSKVIITISREFASGGRLVGEKLASELGITYYDRKLIQLAAEKSGLAPEFIEKSEERASSSFLFSLATNAHATNGYFLQYDVPVNDKAFYAQSEVIREIAEKESCVIVGRCAGYILRENPACINVFVHGGTENRLKRAVMDYGIDHEGLEDRLTKLDKGRSNYHKYYTGENWYDIRAYDIMLNTDITGIDGAAYAIAKIARELKTREK